MEWKLIIFLFIIGLVLLNNKKHQKDKKTDDSTVKEGFTQCEYRKQNKGKMCKEKWGEPECHKWETKKKLKKIEEKDLTFIPLKGFQNNIFMYEIDYEEEDEEGGEEEGEEDGKKKDKKNEPKGVHTSFFS